MSYTTTEARDEIREMQAQCGAVGKSYLDHIWYLRDRTAFHSKSSGAWPFRRASQQASNVVEFPSGSVWHLGDGWMS